MEAITALHNGWCIPRFARACVGGDESLYLYDKVINTSQSDDIAPHALFKICDIVVTLIDLFQLQCHLVLIGENSFKANARRLRLQNRSRTKDAVKCPPFQTLEVLSWAKEDPFFFTWQTS